MNHIPVTSSNIESIAWEDGELQVKFKDRTLKNGTERPGGVYSYLGVPRETYNAFLEADSPGTFFRTRISGVFAGAKQ